MNKPFIPIHKHLLLAGIVKFPITEVSDGKQMLVDLVKLVGMTPVTEPQAVYVSELGNEGLTGSINLATSHIAFHIWDKTGLLMLDLYSCKDFNEELIKIHLHNLMSFTKVNIEIIDRNDLLNK